MEETKLTIQNVIDAASDLYDNWGFGRARIRQFLEALLDSGKAEEFDIEAVFDLIVG